MSKNMATSLKKKLSAKSITAMILFGAIIMVFVFFGMPTGMGGGLGAAASVNGTLISFRDFQQTADQLEQMYSQYMGGMSFDQQQRIGLRRQALDRLIQEELMAQAARKAGVRATDEEIRSLITQDIPAFQRDGQFQREFYAGYLQSQGLNAGDFEKKIRKQVESMRMRRLFEVSSHPLSMESEKQKSLKEFKMNLQFVKLEDHASKTSTVSTEEVKKALENPDFQARVENEFNLKKSQFSEPEQIRAQHILISSKADDATSDTAALEKAKELRARAEKEDFGQLASTYSDDPGSKTKKGDLGYFGRGAMVPEFENAAFALEVGQISDPIKSPFGYHIIKLSDKKPAKEAKLEEHRESIARDLLVRDLNNKRIEELKAHLNSNPSEADKAIKAMGLKWEETGLFSLDTQAIPKIPELNVEKVAGLSSENPYLTDIFRAGSTRYIVKLKDVKMEKVAASNTTEDLLQKRRADSMFTAWLEDYRQASDIETNNLLFQ